ncbi:MAG: NAAT family transporter [Acetobacteraceae bacterium]|nr:NAAT family transporter [Acetobacteraceae bacterium]
MSLRLPTPPPGDKVLGVTHSFLYALIALLVILDPAGTAVLFAAMTPQDGYAERAEQARRACLIAFVVLALFGIVGEGVLRALGIGLPAMRVAGGVLLFLTAADMVRARSGARVDAREQQAAAATPDDISVFPLAIPLLAGPGAITTMVLLRARAGGEWAQVGVILAALAVALLVTLAALLSARRVAGLLGETGASVAGRVLGVLLAALAAQFALEGVREALG